jgi:hypothetical protein
MLAGGMCATACNGSLKSGQHLCLTVLGLPACMIHMTAGHVIMSPVRALGVQPMGQLCPLASLAAFRSRGNWIA